MKKILASLLFLLSSSSFAQLTPHSIQIFQVEPGGEYFFGRYFYPTVSTDSYFLMYDGNISQPKVGAIGTGLSWDGSVLSSTGVSSGSLSTTLASYATTTALTSGLTAKYNIPAGTTSQYVRGDGSLAAFPSIPSAPVKYSGATNGSGVYAVTYPSAYGSVPNVVITVVGGTNKDSAVLTSTTTGFSVLVERRSDVLGLLPSYAPVTPSSTPTATVNVIVTP